MIVELSSSALRYRLLEGPVRLEPLRVLDSRAVEWQGWHVTFSILGASHATSLKSDGQGLTELLTCAPPATDVRVLAEMAVAMGGEQCVAAAGLICRVRLSAFLLHEGEALRGSYAADSRLTVSFPRTAPGSIPRTHVGWRVAGQCLAVETVHTYPEEERGIRSESLFTIEEVRS